MMLITHLSCTPVSECGMGVLNTESGRVSGRLSGRSAGAGALGRVPPRAGDGRGKRAVAPTRLPYRLPRTACATYIFLLIITGWGQL